MFLPHIRCCCLSPLPASSDWVKFPVGIHRDIHPKLFLQTQTDDFLDPVMTEKPTHFPCSLLKPVSVHPIAHCRSPIACFGQHITSSAWLCFPLWVCMEIKGATLPKVAGTRCYFETLRGLVMLKERLGKNPNLPLGWPAPLATDVICHAEYK